MGAAPPRHGPRILRQALTRASAAGDGGASTTIATASGEQGGRNLLVTSAWTASRLTRSGRDDPCCQDFCRYLIPAVLVPARTGKTMYRSLLIATCLALSSAAQAERLYLDCTLVEGPAVKVTDLYVIVPKTQDKFIEDVWNLGATSAIKRQPTTWVIDTVSGTISSPEGNGDYRQTQSGDAAIEGIFRSETGTIMTFHLNRVDKSVALSLHYAPHSLDAWKVAHGKAFPLNWNWRQICRSVAPM